METIFKVVVFIGMGILTLLVLLPLWARAYCYRYFPMAYLWWFR